jgi:hypothetical protein
MGILINPQQAMAPLLLPHRIEVTDVGDTVKVRIGNATLTLQYETALQLSQLLRLRAKMAKKRAGDMSRHWSSMGILEDARG